MSSRQAQVNEPMARPRESTRALDDTWERVGLAVARIIVGVLWYTQLLWKLPPSFGCPTPFEFSTRSHFTSGLCDWIGREAAFAGNLKILGVNLNFLSSAYGSFLNSVVLPNFSWMAWLIFGMELFITITVLLGLFTRLGALVGTIQGLNLLIGLASVPGEWEWTYILLATMNFILLVTAAGRYFGVDARLHPWAVREAEKGNGLARIIAAIT